MARRLEASPLVELAVLLLFWLGYWALQQRWPDETADRDLYEDGDREEQANGEDE